MIVQMKTQGFVLRFVSVTRNEQEKKSKNCVNSKEGLLCFVLIIVLYLLRLKTQLV